MKKTFVIIISLCLIFGAIVPVYAATEVTNAAWSTWFQTINSNVSTMKTYLQDFTQSWTTFFETMTGGAPSTLLTFQDLVRDVLRIGDWLAPIADYADGLRPSGVASIWHTLENTFTSIVAGFNTENNYLDYIRKGIGHSFGPFASNQGYSLWVDIYNSAHRQLLYANSALTNVATKMNGQYYLPNLSNGGVYTYNGTLYDWNQGTPIGNIALILKQGMINDGLAYNFRWNADLKHYNDQLTTWDSQGNTLSQVAFTPESAIQGLYRYLAFTQRDVARLAYVFASDQELEAREALQDNQSAALDILQDNTVNVTPTNIGDLSDITASAKSSFNTGVSATSIFTALTNNSNLGWFSADTWDKLGGIKSDNRRSKSVNESYTPLLDAKMQEIYDTLGVNVDVIN